MPEPTEWGQRAFARDMGRFLSKQKQRIMARIKSETPLELIWPIEFWEGEKRLLKVPLAKNLQRIAEHSAGILLKTWPVIEEAIITEQILSWVARHSDEIAGTINTYTRRVVENAFTDFFMVSGYTRRDFEDAISSVVSPARAEGIAVTEVTRAHYEGSETVANEVRSAGFDLVGYWNTNADGLVCPICLPLHRLPETPEGGWDPSGTGPGAYPPAHPRCRCWITYSIL